MGSRAEEAFKQFRRELHRYLMRRLRNPNDVEDLAQEVYLRLIRLDSDKVIEKPLAYIYGIASHVLADYRIEVEQQRERVIIDSDTVEEAEMSCVLPDDLADRLNLQQQIHTAMSQLPKMHAKVILAHKRDGFSYEEVAESLDLSIHTIEKYVTQSKSQLRKMHWER